MFPDGRGGKRLKLSSVLALVATGVVLAAGGIVVADDKEATCPVSGHKFAITDKTVTLTVNGQKESFCCGNCPTAFVKDPGKYVKGDLYCPVMTGNKVDPSKSPRVAVNNNLFFVCCGGCPSAIANNLSKYVKETKDPVSGEGFKVSENTPHSMYRGVHYLFASDENKKTFDTNPEKYSNKLLSKTS
jgi:YHS domain-containing protein